MHFIFPTLAWGFLLVAIPFVIHLLNLLRMRRIQWPAMEFLLQANKKQRRWIRFRQWLLLALRMLAIALIVAMLAHLVTRSNWARLFSAQTTHHIVLLDDSFSMSERIGSDSGFQRARQVVREIAQTATRADSPQEFTLIRYSDAVRWAQETPDHLDLERSDGDAKNREAPAIGLYHRAVDKDFMSWLQDQLRDVDVTNLAVQPNAASRIAVDLVETTADRRSLVYLISDFRANDWQSSEQIDESFSRIRLAGGKIHLVRCVSAEQSNLSVAEIQPTEGTRAAGVPLFVDVAVTNSGVRATEQVPLTIRTTRYHGTRDLASPDTSLGETRQLPQAMLDSIAPGETVMRRVQVFFPTAGKHVVQVELPPDSIEADNRRWKVIDVPETISVLIIDDDSQQRNAYHLSTVFEPGVRAETGVRATVRDTAFLRDTAVGSLAEYQSIYLLDPVRLDIRAIRNLSEYVSQGGGLATFAGPNVDLDFYDRWYDDGQGVYPVPLRGLGGLNSVPGDVPDLQVTPHPLFEALLGERNPFVGSIRFRQFLKVPSRWSPPATSTVRVLARTREDDPLIVEQSIGDGHVVAVLSTLAPLWNNWARQPSFVVFVLQLQSYLGRTQWNDTPLTVGEPLTVELDQRKHGNEVVFLKPRSSSDEQTDGESQARIVQRADPAEGDTQRMVARLGGTASGTDEPGIYEAWSRQLDGKLHVDRYAYNVDPHEGRLRVFEAAALKDSFGQQEIEVVSFDQLYFANLSVQRGSLTHWMLGALILLLIAEQTLAYITSYHPSTVRA